MFTINQSKQSSKLRRILRFITTASTLIGATSVAHARNFDGRISFAGEVVVPPFETVVSPPGGYVKEGTLATAITFLSLENSPAKADVELLDAGHAGFRASEAGLSYLNARFEDGCTHSTTPVTGGKFRVGTCGGILQVTPALRPSADARAAIVRVTYK